MKLRVLRGTIFLLDTSKFLCWGMCMRKLLMMLPIILLIIFTPGACGQPGDLPLPVNNNFAKKGIPYIDSSGANAFRPIEMVCYIDTGKYNPLNTLDYALQDSGLLFFDYVILSGVILKTNGKSHYLSFTDDLKNLLDKRKKYIDPLRLKGIKVLLGVKSEGNASFGQLSDDKMYALCDSLYAVLNDFQLDGYEFYDDADTSAYPDITGYFTDPDKDDYNDEYEWYAEQWGQGGKYFNNIFYVLRKCFYNKAPDYLSEDEKSNLRYGLTLFVRENKYGRMLSSRPFIPEGFGEFTGSNLEITYSYNAFYNEYREKSCLIYRETTTVQELLDIIANKDNTFADSWLEPHQYGPLAIDLDGDYTRNIYFPQLENAQLWVDTDTSGEVGQVLNTWYDEFKASESQVIFFNNLMPLNETQNNPYYRWIGYDSAFPETEWGDPYNADAWDDEGGTRPWNPAYVPLLAVFSELTQKLFGEDTICSGGLRVKDW